MIIPYQMMGNGLFFLFDVQLRHDNTQYQIQVQLLQQEVGVVKSKNANDRSEEDATLNAMNGEIKRLIAEK